MKKKKDVYSKLKKQGLTDKEIAEAFILPMELTPEEKKEADKELMKIINERRNERNG